MKTLDTSNQESRAAANISESRSEPMVMGDWKQYIGNGEVINNFLVPVQVWSNDRGVYRIPAGGRSEAWGEDVDHVRDGRGNWWKIGWNVATVDALGNVHGAECRTPTFGVDCPEEEIEDDGGGTGGTESSDAGVPLPGGVQPKLEVNQPNDRFEQEADAVAEKVVSGEQSIQRKCTACEEEDKIQRQTEDDEEDEELQMKPLVQMKTSSRNSGTQTTPWVEQQIQSQRGSGQNLSKHTRSYMESGIGASFQNVKVHTDSTSVQMNRELGARAFTVGNDIFFNSGEYSPESSEGKKLLAHELTHTVQQGANQGTVQAKNLIQRKSIPYKQLTWEDFEGTANSTKYEAYTSAKLTDPELSKIKPKNAEVTEAGKCETEGEGEAPTKYKAVIEFNPEDFKVETKFNTTSSWKQTWTTDEDAQKNRCKTKAVDSCKANIKSNSKKGSEEDVKGCKKATEKLKDNQFLTYDCDGEEKKVTKKSECDPLKDCFEKNRLSTQEWSLTFNEKYELSATGVDECSDGVKDKCETTIMPALSKDLLSHEQGHLDITKRFSEQIQKDLRAKAEELKTEAEGCSEEEAVKNAKAALKARKYQTEFSSIWTDGKKKLGEIQKQYDNETEHSVKSEQQGDWEVKISTGDFESNE